MKILLAEDENDLRDVLTEFLQEFDHDVYAVENGLLALEESRRNAFDVIVLDIMMPVMDGLTALSQMREEGNVTPVLMLTAKSEVDDKIEGLNAGADDYLAKPFVMKELLARINALTRRRNVFETKILTVDNLKLNTESGTISAVNSISLSNQETRLMELLIHNREKKYTMEEILNRIWPEEDSAGTGLVKTYLLFLTDKLESIGANVEIRTDEQERVWLA
ncbi:MAG: response regulator transcription factor [Lachnospiraceae bacterium]|nr:response regulator transcription factor [Lachnospiraceae bacterium]